MRSRDAWTRPAAEAFGDRVLTLRKRLGMTQMQFSRELGVSFATVNRWENGRVGRVQRAKLRALDKLQARTAGRPAKLKLNDDVPTRKDLPALRELNTKLGELVTQLAQLQRELQRLKQHLWL